MKAKAFGAALFTAFVCLAFACSPRAAQGAGLDVQALIDAAAAKGAGGIVRIPAGHHEGFIEGFANIYKEFCAAVLDRKAHDFPGPREGVRTMKFVEAALASSAGGARWKAI